MPGPARILTEPPRVLLTLKYAGRTWRLADIACDPLDNAGRALHYQGGLPPLDLFDEAEPFEVSVGSSTELEVLLPEDLAQLLSEHHTPSEMRGEIAWWSSGDSWNDREVKVEGDVRIGAVGVAGQPSKLTITGYDPADDESSYPSDDMLSSDETWSTGSRDYDPAVEGNPYQTVFGHAGVIRKGGAWANVASVPVYPVVVPNSALISQSPWGHVFGSPGVDPNPTPTWTDYVLVGCGFIHPNITAVHGPGTNYEIQVWGGDGSTEWAYLYYAIDDLGRIVSIAGKNAWSTLYGGAGIVHGNTYYVTAEGGGIPGPDGTSSMEGAGDIIRWALERTSIRVDWRRTGAALAQLNAFRLGGYWDQAASPWEWLQDNVFPLLPCSWVAGPYGIYPVVWRWNADASQAVASLVDGLNCCIEGDIGIEGQDRILSTVSLEYGRGLLEGAWRKTRAWKGASGSVVESESLHTRQAALRATGGAKRESFDESVMVYEDATAGLSLAWQAQVRSKEWNILRVVGPGTGARARLQLLEPGDPVAITSLTRSLASRVAFVRRAGWLGAIAYADLILFPQP